MADIAALGRKAYSTEITSSVIEESFALFAKSIRFGWQREFYQAAALYNIKTFGEFAREGKSFSEFIEGIGISSTSIKRYVRIGKCLTEMMFGEKNTVHYLTEKALDQICAEIPSDEKITLRGLDKASKSLITFKKYLSGEIKEEKLGLIPEKESAPKKITAHIIESKTASSEALAFELWKQLEEMVEQMPNSLWQLIETHSKAYCRFYEESDDDFKKEVGNTAHRVSQHLKRVQSIIMAIHRCDFDEAEQIFHNNLSEEI